MLKLIRIIKAACLSYNYSKLVTYFAFQILTQSFSIKDAVANYVEIATEMNKCFRLKDMLDFNVL